MTTIESRSFHPIPPKRSFAVFDEPDLSSTEPATAKRLRPGAVEVEQAAKSVQQPKPLPPKRPYTSFLEGFVDQPPSSPSPKRYRPESVDTFVAEWLESVYSREKHCRSDTLLRHSGDDLIPRRLTKSAPNMEYARDARDADGFVLPPTPASTGSRSFQADAEDHSQVSWCAQSSGPLDAASSAGGSGRSSGESLVKTPLYRDMNLAANNIYLRHPYEAILIIRYPRSGQQNPYEGARGAISGAKIGVRRAFVELESLVA